jgi:hypothetical protein
MTYIRRSGWQLPTHNSSTEPTRTVQQTLQSVVFSEEPEISQLVFTVFHGTQKLITALMILPMKPTMSQKSIAQN